MSPDRSRSGEVGWTVPAGPGRPGAGSDEVRTVVGWTGTSSVDLDIVLYTDWNMIFGAGALGFEFKLFAVFAIAYLPTEYELY